MGAPLFGRFLEFSLVTRDILASVEFWQRLGFSLLTVNDTWSHRYGVVSDGHVCLGLHERAGPAPSLTFVLPELASHVHDLRARGIEPHYTRLGESDFHELQFHDPCGQLVTLLEARTFAPPGRGMRESRCGWFSCYSMPVLDAEHPQLFWERAGLVALPEIETPFAHLPLTGDGLSLALHRPRLFEAPVFIFSSPDMPERIAALQDAELLGDQADLPRGLAREQHALLRAPEGTLLLLLTAEP